MSFKVTKAHKQNVAEAQEFYERHLSLRSREVVFKMPQSSAKKKGTRRVPKKDLPKPFSLEERLNEPDDEMWNAQEFIDAAIDLSEERETEKPNESQPAYTEPPVRSETTQIKIKERNNALVVVSLIAFVVFALLTFGFGFSGFTLARGKSLELSKQSFIQNAPMIQNYFENVETLLNQYELRQQFLIISALFTMCTVLACLSYYIYKSAKEEANVDAVEVLGALIKRKEAADKERDKIESVLANPLIPQNERVQLLQKYAACTNILDSLDLQISFVWDSYGDALLKADAKLK